MNQELIEQAQMLHAESEALEERITFIDQQVRELTDFLSYLDVLEKSPESSGLATIGKGIFIESSFKAQQLFVDVGANVFVTKKPREVKGVIAQQLQGLAEMRQESHLALREIHGEFEKIVKQVEQLR